MGTAHSFSVRDEASYLGEYEHLTLVRIRLAEHSFEGVNPLLERLLVLAESQKRMGSVIEILILQSLAYQAQNDRPQSLTILKRALTLSEPEGYIRNFVDEGKPMAELLAKIDAKDGTLRMKEYVYKLLAALGNPIHPSSFIIQHLADPLSERELEVLKLLRSELSGPEIAERLIVSLNTLRTHTKNIFNKLGVNNRRSAIRRAEELDLF
ncbi:MAG: hypothetical protein IPJ47_12505 [Anaerolineales bacterium]|nr:hypothetical protein [Anaerolineales bacterium]